MNKSEAITTLLGKQELETLIFFVKKAEECGSQHLAWNDNEQRLLKMASCDVEFDRQEFLRRHPALEALASLQFVSFRKTGDSRIGENYHLTLYPAAIHRAKHEERSALGKKWESWRLPNQEKMTVIAFWTSLALAFIRILDFLNSP